MTPAELRAALVAISKQSGKVTAARLRLERQLLERPEKSK